MTIPGQHSHMLAIKRCPLAIQARAAARTGMTTISAARGSPVFHQRASVRRAMPQAAT